MLHPYWFEFFLSPQQPQSTRCGRGCGVTAHDYNDAIRLLREFVFQQGDMPPIRHVIEDVDISMLDDKHIRPRMGVPSERGVWFPLTALPPEWA